MSNGKKGKGKAMRTRTSLAVVLLQLPVARTLIQTSSFAIILLLNSYPSRAETPSIPWECSTYNGDAQTRCLNTLIELQREKIGQLEGQLRAQEGTVSRLKDQVNQQTALTTDLQRRLSDQPAMRITPTFYPPAPYLNFYPPTLGFGVQFGSPWAYGPFHLHGPFWGQPYYRSWLYFR
jgi:hypothetical protein